MNTLLQRMGAAGSGVDPQTGVDALIDPVRTSVNLLSHCTAPAVVARWEGAAFKSDLEAVEPESMSPESIR